MTYRFNCTALLHVKVASDFQFCSPWGSTLPTAVAPRVQSVAAVRVLMFASENFFFLSFC